MQPIKYLIRWLEEHASSSHFLFTSKDFRVLFPELSYSAFKTLLSRATTDGYLKRVCRGLYLYEKIAPKDGLLLFHAAAMLRSNAFNYISLETVLSDAGVISQVPIQWVTLMSSGRSNTIRCNDFGTIEFIHTTRTPLLLMKELSYDKRCGLWRASVSLALRDMKLTGRNCDLIDWDIADEFI